MKAIQSKSQFFLLTFLCAFVSLWPAALLADVDHAAFDVILKATVKDERVDYKTVKDKHLADLAAYLDALAKINPEKLEKNESLAYHINLYNAAMIKAVCDRYKPGYSPSENNFGVFKEPLAKINGKPVSLDDIENKIVRPTFKDARIHVALVCGARSCPPILPRAYAAKDLDETLDANMKTFLNDSFRNPIDAGKKTLRLSKLFDWYNADFGGAANVPAYIGKITGKDFGGWKVEFVEYSWELNDSK